MSETAPAIIEMHYQRLGANNEPEACGELEWFAWVARRELGWHIARDEIGDTAVSTVLRPVVVRVAGELIHPPFETLVSCGGIERAFPAYSGDEALDLHRAKVAEAAVRRRL